MQRIGRKPNGVVSRGAGENQNVDGVSLKNDFAVFFSFAQGQYKLEIESGSEGLARIFVTDDKKCETIVFVINKDIAEVLEYELASWRKRA